VTRIGILSDTHIPKAATELPPAVYREFRGVDMILHAGDLVEAEVLKKLGTLAPTHAVCGNMDMPDLKKSLPEKKIIRVEGYKIGLFHGYGPPGRIVNIVAGEFNNVDAIVFGHSHNPLCREIDKTLFFNPGSPTDKIFSPYNSLGMLEVSEKGIRGRIIKI